MRVLVTGAAGFLGSVVCRRLEEEGFEVRPTDRRTTEAAPAGLIEADLLDPGAARELTADCPAVVHLANHTSDGPTGPAETYRENCTMNVHVFQSAVDAGVERLVYASSTQVFSGNRRGDQPDRPSCLSYLPLDGRTPPCPGNAYGASKEAGEALLRYYARYHERLHATAVRWPLLATEGQVREYRRRVPADGPRPGNLLDVGFTMLHVEDAADLVAAVLRRGRAGYHCLLPSAPTNRLGWPIEKVLRTFYPQVPLRKPPGELEGLVDTEPYQALDWWPNRTRLSGGSAEADS